jgi:hypothetical protein
MMMLFKVPTVVNSNVKILLKLKAIMKYCRLITSLGKISLVKLQVLIRNTDRIMIKKVCIIIMNNPRFEKPSQVVML